MKREKLLTLRILKFKELMADEIKENEHNIKIMLNNFVMNSRPMVAV